MFRRNRLNFEEAKKGLEIFASIPLRFTATDFVNSMSLAKQTNLYAYDAYILDCASRYSAPPILTLDQKLKPIAQTLNIKIMEV